MPSSLLEFGDCKRSKIVYILHTTLVRGAGAEMVPWTGGKDSVSCWSFLPRAVMVCNHYGRHGPETLLDEVNMALNR
jgi:hypothetical protein